MEKERKWTRKGSYRGEEGKTVYIFVRDTPSPHRFSLGSPFLARFFFKHRSHNTYTRRKHTIIRMCTRDANAGGRALTSSELPAIRIQMIGRLHFYKGEREARSAPFSSPPLQAPISWTTPPPPLLAFAFPSVTWFLSARSTFKVDLLYWYLFVFTYIRSCFRNSYRERREERYGESVSNWKPLSSRGRHITRRRIRLCGIVEPSRLQMSGWGRREYLDP